MSSSDEQPGDAKGRGADQPAVDRTRLLVVDDDASLRRAMARVFRDDYDVAEASDGREGLQKARSHDPAVVITDQRMPQMTGVELLSTLKEELPATIRILVTGFDDYNAIVEAVNAADVHHYFEKPFHPHDLRKVVDMFVRNAALEAQRDRLLTELQASVDELEQANRKLREKETHLTDLVDARTSELREANGQLQEANEQLRELAVRDGLTGLFNHRYLVEHLELEVARSARYDRVFSLLFVDIDDFKRVNDRSGHQVGDAVLRAVADLVADGTERLRRSDVSARYGGEEFCIVLPETPLAGAATKADRIRKAVESIPWTEHGVADGLPVTISIGVGCFPEHGKTAAELLRAADRALYAAKKQGKNRVATYVADQNG